MYATFVERIPVPMRCHAKLPKVHLRRRKLDATSRRIAVEEPIETLVDLKRAANTSCHNGKIHSRVTQLGELPVDDSRTKGGFVRVRKQYVLTKKITVNEGALCGWR